MPNPLDMVMQDDSEELSPFDAAKMRGISIRPTTGADVASAGNDPLTKMIAPQPEQQSWTMEDLMKGLAALKEHVMTGEFSPGTKIGNRMFGTGGEERYQLWPEKMIRSGVGAAGNALSSSEPVTSEQLIAPAMDMAGMAGGSALIERPGAVTLGSGPMRPAMKDTLVPAIKYNDKVYKGERGQEHMDMLPDSFVKSLEKQGVDTNDLDAMITAIDATPKFRTGFVDSKGRFLSHKQAGEHAAYTEGLVDPEHLPYLRDGGYLTADMLLSDTQQPGAAVSAAAQASKGPAPIFYSALEHAATNAAQDVMSPQQWLGYLKNQPGVKQEELNWTGIGNWLSKHPKDFRMHKEEVQRYLDEHKVEIKDVTKHGEGKSEYSNREYDMATDHAFNAMQEEFARLSEKERAKWDNDIDAWMEEPGPRDRMSELETQWLDENAEGMGELGATKYSSYQLPGGENYREHLLTLPEKPWSPEKLEDLPRDQQNAAIMSSGGSNYRSSHWDEPNVLAHVRTNNRDVGGKKSLHIEEIQSDWHQQGRKQGYKKSDKTLETERDKLAEEVAAIQEKHDFRSEEYQNDPAWVTGMQRITGINHEINATGVSDAPFKTTWPELALKRMIRHAAENGYDRISWTPGEAQAARYDLSHHIDRLAYDPTKNRLLAFSKVSGSTSMIDKIVKPDDLAGVIGKEAADKLVNSPTSKGQEPFYPPGEYHKLNNTDLKVGGEGMREFYDKMLPKMAEKIGKAHGVKVKQTALGNGDVLPGEQFGSFNTGKLSIKKAPILSMAVVPIKSGPKEGKFVVVDQTRGQELGVFDTMKQAKEKAEMAAPREHMVVFNRQDADGTIFPHVVKSFDTIKEAEDFVAAHKGPRVHYFDIPQSLRDHAVGKGFPLYMSGVPFPLTPVDHDPFKKERK